MSLLLSCVGGGSLGKAHRSVSRGLRHTRLLAQTRAHARAPAHTHTHTHKYNVRNRVVNLFSDFDLHVHLLLVYWVSRCGGGGSILSHATFEESLSFVLANRLADASMPATEMMDVFTRAMEKDPSIGKAAILDLMAVRERVSLPRSTWQTNPISTLKKILLVLQKIQKKG